MIVLIPAYEPDGRLLELVDALEADGQRMLVVDDGSGQRYTGVFDAVQARGVEVLHQSQNSGKAGALRRGLAYISANAPGEDVVTADSDGQHRPADIAAVADAMSGADALILGGRSFTGDVPVRSRFGNAVSRVLFRMSGGVRLHDTQTGLRGIPAQRIPDVLAVAGERFAWEMNVLLDFTHRRIPIREVAIETVYLDGNASSHFRPVRDSLSVLAPLLRYGAVSFGSFLLDAGAMQLMYLASGELLLSVIAARVLSAGVNFTLNRAFVFRAGAGIRRQILRYLVLALVMLAAGYGLLDVLIGWGMPVLAAKIVADAAVYLAGFLVQRWFVFARTKTDPPAG